MRNSKGQFIKGNIPPFKGKKGIHLSPHSEFKKGCVPWMKGKTHTEESNRKNSESKKNNPTNYWLGKKRVHMSGENNWNWKGGVTDENERARHSIEYLAWRKEVWKRDNWSCRDCGVKCSRKTIVAHHIKLFSEFPELRFSIENGITLCRSCHAGLHKTIKDGIITAITEAT